MTPTSPDNDNDIANFMNENTELLVESEKKAANNLNPKRKIESVDDCEDTRQVKARKSEDVKEVNLSDTKADVVADQISANLIQPCYLERQKKLKNE